MVLCVEIRFLAFEGCFYWCGSSNMTDVEHYRNGWLSTAATGICLLKTQQHMCIIVKKRFA